MYTDMTSARDANGRNRLIDLRSDTVTRPGPGMRAAMAAAEVGDDVYGEDPNVNGLEARVAELVGKEAGLFVPSGTQSNLLAMMTHCRRGEEILTGREYHVCKYEAGGASVLGGAVLTPLEVGDTGGLTAGAIAAAIKADDIHFPVTRMVSLENTWNGRVQDQAEIERIAAVARENGLAMHLDGARLMNAAVASGRAAAELAAPFDTVSLCLSKGLGAPVGSVLSGPADFIRRARRLRKMVGGGMRQAGILAAACHYALDHHVDRMAEDHANARALAEGLAGIGDIEVEYPGAGTNMVFLKVAPERFDAFSAAMADAGVLIGGRSPAIRLVTHLDVSAEDIARVVEAATACFAATGAARQG
ncbi:MAG: low-specificity L-threonine aldolase [Oricola sp.]